MDKKAKVLKFIEFLDSRYADAECSLRHENPFQLITATILSAQCTDARVNIVTETLFKKYPTPEALANAEMEELCGVIKPTGFFRNKAKSLIGMAQKLISEHNGEVPDTMEKLIKLPGVGRKTANVILGNCFGSPAVVVDTHVKRISFRLGLTKNTDPEKIEQDLIKIVPPERSAEWSHQVILFGRDICTARSPKCSECPINGICEDYAARVKKHLKP
jgi:endonuclease-3